MQNVNQTIDKMVKDKFLAIYNAALEDANNYFEQKIQPALNTKSTYDKIKFLNSEDEKQRLISRLVKFSAYNGASNVEEWLLKLFASRLSILNADDSDDLKNAVYCGELGSLITKASIDLKDEVPSFNYNDFLAGKKDVFDDELGYTWHYEDRDDLDKIRKWRAEKISTILASETKLIITTYQENLAKHINPIYQVSDDLKIFEGVIKGQKFESVETLINAFKKLSFLEGYDFEKMNSEESLQSYNLFVDDELAWSMINKDYVENQRQFYNDSDLSNCFTAPPVIFYTVYKVADWMSDVLNTDAVFDEFKFPDYKLIVEQIIEEAELSADDLLTKFENKNDFHNLSNEQKERVLGKAINNCRREFNNLQEFEKQYYAAIHREHVESVFKLNTLFFDFDYHVEGLKKAAQTYFNFVYFFSQVRESTNGKHIFISKEYDQFNPHEVLSLAYSMVLDNDLHHRMREIYDNNLIDLVAYGLHIDLFSMNYRESLHNLFLACIERLSEYLEEAEPSSKVLFIQSRLKELKFRELKGKVSLDADSVENKFSYTTMLKEYLEIEAEFIKETKDISFFEQAKPLKQIQVAASGNSKKSIEKTLSFGCRTSKETLLAFISELNRQIYLLRDDAAGVNDLVTVLTAEDLNSKLPSITFNCETTQLYYIFNKLKPYFVDLSFKNIENSQLFFTKNGNPLKAQNLSASKVDFPKNYKEIDKAFALFQ